ncbi:MAG: VTC domain-containing protein [Actinomycetaceae bacterium]|nr:VTC domain-containing protein [Actinomycetaceae bacterium]
MSAELDAQARPGGQSGFVPTEPATFAARPSFGSSGELFERIPVIGLEELHAQAALLHRVDRKYLVSYEQTSQLVDYLASEGARVLEIEGLREFSYLSDYFDTADFRLFRAAATKRRRRFKVRTRVYLDSGLRFVELKTRGGRGHNIKDRLRLEDVSARTCEALRTGAPAKYDNVLERHQVVEWVAGLLTSYGIHQTYEESVEDVKSLSGSLRSTYRRSTLHLPTNSRLTIDQGLSLADPTGIPRFRIPNVVVETKSAGRPSEADRWLWRHGLRPIRFSKYAVGMAQLHDELPANRWRRALNRLGGIA